MRSGLARVLSSLLPSHGPGLRRALESVARILAHGRSLSGVHRSEEDLDISAFHTGAPLSSDFLLRIPKNRSETGEQFCRGHTARQTKSTHETNSSTPAYALGRRGGLSP